jgi:hypothetical protein
MTAMSTNQRGGSPHRRINILAHGPADRPQCGGRDLRPTPDESRASIRRRRVETSFSCSPPGRSESPWWCCPASASRRHGARAVGDDRLFPRTHVAGVSEPRRSPSCCSRCGHGGRVTRAMTTRKSRSPSHATDTTTLWRTIGCPSASCTAWPVCCSRSDHGCCSTERSASNVAIRVAATVAVTAAIAASAAQVRNRRENSFTVPPLESSSDRRGPSAGYCRPNDRPGSPVRSVSGVTCRGAGRRVPPELRCQRN